MATNNTNDSLLQEAKENLAKYKTFEAEHEEGFDGHHEWNEEDQNLLAAQAYFYKAVKKRYYLEVRAFLAIIMPGGAEDARIAPIQRLLTNTSSEEALKEALLLAISTGSRPVVEFILTLFVDCPYLERSGCANSSNFPPHMTPLMLACIHNNYSVVQCLLLRGHTIAIPHFLTCECAMCRRQTVSTRANTRLADVMRALSSEAYLWLATDDVFAATCAIAKDLQQLIEEDELEQIEIYRVLEANVQRFMARLADQAWRAEEFNAVVANKNHCGYHNTEVSSPRLQLAMDSQMRQFTCSANTQTAIKSIFRADWYNFGNKPKRDAWRLLRTSFLMPFVVILHAIMPTMGTTMAIPLARYMAHISMYLLFLFTAVARPTIGYSKEWQTPNDFRITALEMFMYSYVFGLIVEKGMLMKRIGPDTFFAYWWRWFDIFFISSYSVSFFFFVCTKVNREQFDPADIDRMHWPSNEFLLLHEIFLSIACVFGISKCFYYLQMMKGIGGSIISVGKCVGKTYTYLVIMVIVIVSFSVGLNILVGPYVNRKLIRPDGSTDAETTDSYDTIGMTTKNLFWSIFGYLGPSTYITVVGNTGYHMDPVSHQLNSATLEVLGALYHGIIIITVLNLMTSLLVKKADEVLDNEEMEFKYTRAAIYSEFLTWHMAAPPPLNLLLLPLHWMHRNMLDRRFESPSWGRDVDKVDEAVGEEELKEEEHNTYRYLEILCTLFSRFCASKECKYRTVWRTEFDKEQKQLTTVSFLSAGPHAFPMDNTYEGWRWRSSKILHLPPAPPNPDFLAAPYIMKGTAREAVMVYKARDVEGHTAQEGPQSEVNVEIPTKPAVAPPPAPPPPQVLVVPVKKPGPNLV